MKRCSQCGAPIENKNDTICMYCGSPLDTFTSGSDNAYGQQSAYNQQTSYPNGTNQPTSRLQQSQQYQQFQQKFSQYTPSETSMLNMARTAKIIAIVSLFVNSIFMVAIVALGLSLSMLKNPNLPEKARADAETAKKLSVISIIIGVILYAVRIITVFSGF